MAQQKDLGKVNGYIEEMMEGQKVVKVFTHEQKTLEGFRELNDKLKDSAKQANSFANIIMPVTAQLGNISYAICALAGAAMAVSGVGSVTLGTVMAFLALNKSFNMPISQVSMQANSIIMALAGACLLYTSLHRQTHEGVKGGVEVEHEAGCQHHGKVGDEEGLAGVLHMGIFFQDKGDDIGAARGGAHIEEQGRRDGRQGDGEDQIQHGLVGQGAAEGNIFFEQDVYKRQPSTKAEIGDHDENISYEQSIDVLEKQFPGHGEEYATKLRDYTIALYKKCAEYALSRGIIIADTKFEFGLDENGNVVLGDEMLTPDSSRFWPLEGYEPGHSQPSFDKQFVRDWLKANPDSNYDLPQDVIDKTIAKYLEAYELLTGKKL